MVVQMPANTLTWSDVVNGASVIDGFVTGKLLNAVGGGALEYAPYEFNAIGNIVGDKQIAGLIYMSQQSLNTGTGTIKSIDYANESLTLTSGAVLKINDPKGRFGAGRRWTRASAWTTRTRRSTPAPAIRCASRAPIRPRRTIRSARSRIGRTA